MTLVLKPEDHMTLVEKILDNLDDPMRL